MDKIDKNEFQWLKSNGLLVGLIIFVLNLVIKGLFLEEPAIGMDEPFTLFRVQKSYSELITDLAQNNHPPFFESIMWLWIRLVGYKATLLRIIPLLFSSLAAAALFLFGKKHFSPFVGVVAALLFTFSDYHFYLSHEIRSYPLFALLTIVSFHFYFNLIDGSKLKSDLPRALIWLTVVNTLLLYTHYFSATIIVSQFFHAIFLVRKKKLNLQMLSGLGLTILLYLPQLIMVKSRMADKVEGGHWLATPSVDELFNVLRKFFNAPIMVVFAIIIIISAAWFLRKANDLKKFSAVAILFPGVYIGMWVLAQWVPVFQDRYISFTTIGAFLLVAIVLDTLPKKIGAFLALVFILPMSILVKYKPQNKQWVTEMADLIRKEKTAETDVFIYPNWSIQCFSYHHNLEFFKDYNNTKKHLENENIYLGYKQDISKFIKETSNAKKLIIINFEGPISELAKDYGQLNHQVIEKDRHGVLIIQKRPL